MITPQQRWASKNKEKVKEIHRKYYLKNKEKIAKYNRENPNRKIYWKKYNDKRNKEEFTKYKRAWTLKYKMLAMKHYCNSDIPFCNCCGEKEIKFLTIDHINGGGSKHRKSINNNRICHWLFKNNYPKGFRVLCMNCNFSRGKYGYCPHEQSKETHQNPY